MAADTSNQDGLQAQLGELIDTLDLDDSQKRFLHKRWLDQLVWMDNRANRTQKNYRNLRLTSIGGGVLVPALVGLKFLPASIIVSLIVAGSTAFEGFFHYGDRWQHYRRTAEQLKSEGWQFSQLSGEYREYNTHREAYLAFATRVEDLIQQDVEGFMKIVREKKQNGAQSTGNGATQTVTQENG